MKPFNVVFRVKDDGNFGETWLQVVLYPFGFYCM